MRTYHSNGSTWRLILFALIIALTAGLYAQDDDFDDMEMEEGPCIPESLQTIYDTKTEEKTGENQVAIWYDYGRDYFQKAKHLSKMEHFQNAIPYFWKAIIHDKSGRFKIVYNRLAECYAQLNKPDSVLIVAYRGLEKYPDNAALHYHAGQIHKSRAAAKCAVPHYEALVKSSSNNKAALKNYWSILAQLYFQMEDEKSIDAQKAVIELDPENVEAASLLAQMMDFFGFDPLEAREQAFKKDPNNIRNARSYGKTAYEMGEYDKTIEAFQAVLTTDEKNIEAMSYIGRAYEGKEQLSDAVTAYREIIKVDPNRLNALCSIASVYARMNRFSQARSYVYKVLKVDRNYGLAYMVMGEIYENAVMHCSGNRAKRGYTYDDKLVFELAQGEYRKAMERDQRVESSARRRYKQLAEFVPTKADRHMTGNRTEVTDACYSWIGK